MRAYCRGCAVGLKDDAGVPIAKPWRMVTNSLSMYEALDSCRCPGPEVHPMHAECQGRYAPMSEGYTPALARKAHGAFHKDIMVAEGYAARRGGLVAGGLRWVPIAGLSSRPAPMTLVLKAFCRGVFIHLLM